MSLLHLEGAYENELAATGEFNPQAPKTALMLPSGQRVVLPTEVLLQALSGTYSLPKSSATAVPAATAAPPDVAAAVTGNEQVIPLVEEQLVVGKREVETGRVHLRRETEERVETVSVPLTDVHWEIEHIPVGEKVESAPEVRQVGETMIFPLVEERLVVTRELWLLEEVHVHKVKTTVEKSADFAVKRDVLIEDRSRE